MHNIAESVLDAAAVGTDTSGKTSAHAAAMPAASSDGAPAPQALAMVFGEPVLEAPRDLYIPPDALRVLLERFEGPLDLLLYLIRRQNLDILDIPMVDVTAQYLRYVEAVQAHRLELAAEYLLMAAVLIEIKSRMLLPRPAVENAGEAEDDPRAALVRKLLVYEQMKLAAHALEQLPLAERDFSWATIRWDKEAIVRLPNVDTAMLARVWADLLVRARNFRDHTVALDGLSVREQMGEILRALGDGRHHEFTTLLDITRGTAFLVVSFMAILELAREGMIQIAQAEPYLPIYLCLPPTVFDKMPDGVGEVTDSAGADIPLDVDAG